MSEQVNKAIVSRLYEEMWNGRNLGEALAVADELIAPDFVCHGSGGETLDREDFKRYVSKVRTGMNFRHIVEDLIAEGDTVAARLTGHGETSRKVLGLNLSHKQFVGTGVAVWKLSNGQITERWAVWGPALSPC